MNTLVVVSLDTAAALLARALEHEPINPALVKQAHALIISVLELDAAFKERSRNDH